MKQIDDKIDKNENHTPRYETADPMSYALLKDFAKRLRNNPTEAESIMWTLLRNKQLGAYKFRRQHIIGRFIPDFVCLKQHLIIEIDGGYHNLPEVQISDKKRTETLNKLGYRVLRFTNEEVICKTDSVLNKIKMELDSQNPSPSVTERSRSIGRVSEGLKIKICGMRSAQNIAEVLTLQPNYMGFIFYPKSARYVGEDWPIENIQQLPATVTPVGVFVNENIGYIMSLCNKYGIKTVQLHGQESPRFCIQLQRKGYTVFKAFQVDNNTNIEEILAYQGKCDLFLYDTKSKGLGGSGLKFNWDKLNELNEAGPFLLSGGISADDAETIKGLNYSNLVGVDINSKFEIEPALKNVELLKEFIKPLLTVPKGKD